MDDFASLLHSKGFRATPGRVQLMRVLYTARRPLTADEIGSQLDLNVVTVYRALNELAKCGLLLRGVGSGTAMHFSYPVNHHHHMVCAECGFTKDCAVC